MKLVELDKKLSEEITTQPIQEGPFDWMLRSSRIGQWLAGRDGRKAQQEMATMYIKALSSWRGFQGAKQLTPELLTKWLSDPQRNFGLGLPSNEVQEILADPNVQKSLVTRNPNGVLDNSGVKNFIIALSRANFDEIKQAASANPKLASAAGTDPLNKAAQQTTGAGTQAANRVGLVAPVVGVVPGATAPAQTAPAQTAPEQPAPAAQTAPAQTAPQAPAGGSAITTGANQAQAQQDQAQAQQQAQTAAIQNSIKLMPAPELAIVKKMLQKQAAAPTESIEEVSATDVARGIGRAAGAVAGAARGAVTGIARGASKGFQAAKDAFAGGEMDFEDLKTAIVDFTPEQAKAMLNYIQKLETVRKNQVKVPQAKPKAKAGSGPAKEPVEPRLEPEPELRVEPGGKKPEPSVASGIK